MPLHAKRDESWVMVDTVARMLVCALMGNAHKLRVHTDTTRMRLSVPALPRTLAVRPLMRRGCS